MQIVTRRRRLLGVLALALAIVAAAFSAIALSLWITPMQTVSAAFPAAGAPAAADQ